MKEQALKLNQYLDSAVDDLKQSTVRASRSLQANENDQVTNRHTHRLTRVHTTSLTRARVSSTPLSSIRSDSAFPTRSR